MESRIVAKPKVGVVGGGVVGGAMQALCGPETVIYDPYKPELAGNKDAINACDVVFICVPTPISDDGSCNTSIVEETVAWVEAPLMIIRSTVAPGTTDRLCKKYDKHIVFQPEYSGRDGRPRVRQRWLNASSLCWVARPRTSRGSADFYKHYYNAIRAFLLRLMPITAEVCKYMENAFYAVEGHLRERVLRHREGARRRLQPACVSCGWRDTRISRDHTLRVPREAGFLRQVPAEGLQRDRAFRARAAGLRAGVHGRLPEDQRQVPGPEPRPLNRRRA